MEATRLLQVREDLTKNLFAEGFLDDQFTQLQMLQDESNPNFVGEVISLFLDDSERLLNDLTRSLEQEQVDFRNVDAYVHRFKGSSASVGAQRVKEGCIEFRNLTEEKNIDGCRKALGSIKQEFNLVKNHLKTLLQLEQNILTAGGIVPMTD